MSDSLRLGDVEVARVGLGTNRLTHSSEHVEFVREAVAAGIAHIDTAHTYAGGDSEHTIGEALSSSAASGTVMVATKGGYAAGTGRPEVLRTQLDESLRRLRVDAISLYYLHRVDPQTPLEESLGLIGEYRDAGKVRHVGISDVTVEQIEQARRVVPITAVQNHYSLWERKYDAVVDHCTREGIVFVPYFPLRGEPSGALMRIADAHGATPAQVALAWLLQRSPLMLPIPGTLSIEHVKENLAAFKIELTDDELAELDR